MYKKNEIILNRILKMEIKLAEFIKSSVKLEQCPDTNLPEFAFVGRSNVGKSTLINFLTWRRKLAKASKTPGKTKEINHFLINNEWYLVDLPGYGYAKSSREKRAERVGAMFDYLTQRKQLKVVFVLVDGKVPPQGIDIDFLEELAEESVHHAVIFTKLDKTTQKEFHKNMNEFIEKVEERGLEVPKLFTSSSIKKRGDRNILGFIDELLD